MTTTSPQTPEPRNQQHGRQTTIYKCHHHHQELTQAKSQQWNHRNTEAHLGTSKANRLSIRSWTFRWSKRNWQRKDDAKSAQSNEVGAWISVLDHTQHQPQSKRQTEQRR